MEGYLLVKCLCYLIVYGFELKRVNLIMLIIDILKSFVVCSIIYFLIFLRLKNYLFMIYFVLLGVVLNVISIYYLIF